jgi:ParB-like chromosome segregation protein Spo0J
VVHLLTSAQGLPLSPLDAGLQYVKLRRFGLSTAKIASRIGKSVSHVHECLTLAGDGDSDVHAHVRANEVSASTASKLVRQHGSQAGAVIRKRLEASTTGRVVAEKPARQTKPCEKCELAIFLLTKMRDRWIGNTTVQGEIDSIIGKLS